MHQTNFGQNLQIAPQHFYTPKSDSEIIGILNRHKGQRIRCVGRRHSWSKVLESDDVLLDLRNFNGVEPEENAGKMSVRVGAGCQVKRLLAELKRLKQWTLPSVGLITEQTLAGAIATGTHGSGKHSLSHYVVSLRVARYDRDRGCAVIEEISTGDELRAARCALGCVGVILNVTMQCRSMYSVEEHWQEYSNLSHLLNAEDEYPLQQFFLVPWRWTYFVQHRRETEASASKFLWLYHWYRFLVFDVAMHLLILFIVRSLQSRTAVRAAYRWMVPSCVIRDWKVAGPSNKQLVMEHELFRHLEMELFVQRNQLEAALGFLQDTLIAAGDVRAAVEPAFLELLNKSQCSTEFDRLRDTYFHHYPICVRKILPDDTLISMASNAGATVSVAGDGTEPASLPSEAWYSITMTNYHRGSARKPFEEVAKFLAVNMAQLFGARPHWGKLCPLSADELFNLYPAFDRFVEVCDQVDPDQRFSNSWTRELISTARSQMPNQKAAVS